MKTGRDWSDVSTSRGVLRSAGDRQELGRGEEGFHPVSEGAWPS